MVFVSECYMIGRSFILFLLDNICILVVPSRRLIQEAPHISIQQFTIRLTLGNYWLTSQVIALPGIFFLGPMSIGKEDHRREPMVPQHSQWPRVKKGGWL